MSEVKKDWTGDKNSIFKTLGASNHTDKEREQNDYYATDPVAIDVLLKDGEAKLAPRLWECSCGAGHLSKRLEEYGYKVYSSDLIDRGYGTGGVDFLKCSKPFNGDIITNPPYKCFSSDTECYTKQGWKRWEKLTLQDEILSVNPKTLVIEWSGINQIFHYQIDEEVYHFKKNSMDILCTKDHRMMAYKDGQISCKKGDLILSQDIRSRHYIPRTGYSWKGKEEEFFVLPGMDGIAYAQPVYKPPIKIPMKHWIKFFGMWLADGYCRHTKNSQGNFRKTVGIKQIATREKMIEEILSNLPFSYKKYEDNNRPNPCINFEIHNEQLWAYLKQFGTSSEKFIPEQIKNLDSFMLKEFIDSYFKGDGSNYAVSKEGRVYRSSSRKLIEDIQEILLKLGYLSHIFTQKYTTSLGQEKKCYMITYSPDSIYNKFYYPSAKKSLEHYKGIVWCVNLKKNGAFLLRRNGKEFISGNCAQEFIEHGLELIPDGRKVFMFLKLQFLEGINRRKLFDTGCLKTVYVSSRRILCAKNGDFDGMRAGGGSAVAYAWYEFEKGYYGDTKIKWIN